MQMSGGNHISGGEGSTCKGPEAARGTSVLPVPLNQGEQRGNCYNEREPEAFKSTPLWSCMPGIHYSLVYMQANCLISKNQSPCL